MKAEKYDNRGTYCYIGHTLLRKSLLPLAMLAMQQQNIFSAACHLFNYSPYQPTSMKAFFLITISLELKLLLAFLFAYFLFVATDAFMRRHLKKKLWEGVASIVNSVCFFHKVMRSNKILNQLFLSCFSFS